MDSRAERVKEKLYPLASRKSDEILVNQSTFCSEFSSTLLVPFAVLGTQMEGYQKSGTVRFAILVPFKTSDNGNGHNCVPYCTVLNRTAQWKRAIGCILTRQAESRLMQVANRLRSVFDRRSLTGGDRGHDLRCHSDLTHRAIIQTPWDSTQLSKLWWEMP